MSRHAMTLALLVSFGTALGQGVETAGWIEDLDFLAKELPQRHKNAFFKQSKEDFERRTAELRAKIAQLSEQQIVAELRRLVASVGDGHTSVLVGAGGTEKLASRVLPAAFIWLEDGIFAAALPSEHAALLGRK